MPTEPVATAASIPYEGTDCTAEGAVEAVQAVRATAADVNSNRTFHVTRITVVEGSKLVLGPDDQAFHIGVTHHGQYPSQHTFVLLERVDPDAPASERND